MNKEEYIKQLNYDLSLIFTLMGRNLVYGYMGSLEQGFEYLCSNGFSVNDARLILEGKGRIRVDAKEHEKGVNPNDYIFFEVIEASDNPSRFKISKNEFDEVSAKFGEKYPAYGNNNAVLLNMINSSVTIFNDVFEQRIKDIFDLEQDLKQGAISRKDFDAEFKRINIKNFLEEAEFMKIILGKNKRRK